MVHEDTPLLPAITSEDWSASSERDYELGLINSTEAAAGIPPHVSLYAGGRAVQRTIAEAATPQPEKHAETDQLTIEAKRLAKKHGGHPNDYDWRYQ
jgi:hypothetical protein